MFFLVALPTLGPGADKMLRQNETNKTFSFMAVWSTVRCGFPAVFSIPHRRRCFFDPVPRLRRVDRDSLQGRFGACLEIPKNTVTWKQLKLFLGQHLWFRWLPKQILKQGIPPKISKPFSFLCFFSKAFHIAWVRTFQRRVPGHSGSG